MTPDSPLMPSATIAGTQRPSLLNSPKALSFPSQATSVKVVIVGSEGVGKTSFVRRFVSDELGIPIDEVTPTASSSVCSLSSPSPLQRHRRRRRERPPGTISTGNQQHSEVELDIYELELPSRDEISTSDNRGGDGSNGNIHRLSIWDFSGKAESLQAVQKIFFTPQTLYVVLWDMAAKDVTPLEYECAHATANTSSGHFSASINFHCQQSIKCSKHSINSSTHNSGSQSQSHRSTSSSTFNLGYDSDSDSSDYDYYNDCDVDVFNQEELRVMKRKLEKDIDKKVQCWIDRIQAIAPGATILPMATHMDKLIPKNRSDFMDSTSSFTTDEFQQREVKKRCRLLKERLASNESRKVEGLKSGISTSNDCNGKDSFGEHLSRPNFLFGNVQKDGQVIPYAIAASCNNDEDSGIDSVEIDDTPLKLQIDAAVEYEESFSSALNFILSTALTIAAREKKQDRQEPGCEREDPAFHKEDVSLGDKQSIPASLATVMLRDVRQKLWHRSKIVQTNYFAEKFETREHDGDATGGNEFGNDANNSAVLSALHLLHLSGELCYFGGTIPSSGFQHQEQLPGIELLSDFVVLDPTWLIESIDFILQYGKKNVQNTRNGRVRTDLTESSGRHRATNCPTIEKEEIQRLWKNRYGTKQGLGLAEHYHQFQYSDEESKRNGGVADQVFEFIQNVLIRHDVFVPLSYEKSGSMHFFLPCLLHQKKSSRGTLIKDSSQNTLLVPPSSILQDLLNSNNFIPENERYTDPQIDLDSASLKGPCHGFVIVDTAPDTLMERTIVHTMKSLRGILSTNCEPKIEAEELYFWKNSVRLKLRVYSGNKMKEQTVAIDCVLLEASGCGANSRIVSFDSMLVTYLQGCKDPGNQEIWRQACSMIRGAIQNALDEIPGIEYREEGICPHCLRKNNMSDTGTWTLSKLQSAFNNREASVRCRHGHRTETKLNGLLHCLLVESARNHFVQKEHSSSTDRTNPSNEARTGSKKNLILLKNQPPLSQKGKSQHSPPGTHTKNLDQTCSSSKGHAINDTTFKENSFFDTIIDHRDVELSSTIGYMAKTKPTTRVSETSIERELNEVERKENDQALNSKVMLLLDRCKTKMQQIFHKKNHLDLDNRNMTDCQIPMELLNGTKFGHHLQSVSLSYNKLETLPQSFVRCLPNLKYMNLSHCLIYELPKRWNLPLLKKLDVSHNLLIGFPEETILFGLLELEELDLSGNRLTKVKVSTNPHILKKLKRLNLSSNELTSFPTSLNRFSVLKSLDLKFNNFPTSEKKSQGGTGTILGIE